MKSYIDFQLKKKKRNMPHKKENLLLDIVKVFCIDNALEK